MTSHQKLNNMLLASVGVDPEEKVRYNGSKKYADWEIYKFKKDNTNSIPVMLIEKGPKSISDAKRIATGDGCIMIFRTSMKKSGKRYKLFLKSNDSNTIYSLENEVRYQHASRIFKDNELDKATDELDMLLGIENAIHNIHEDTGIFINRGAFSNHYLNNRLFNDLKYRDIKIEADAVVSKINGTVWEILDSLNWKNASPNKDVFRTDDGIVSILVVKPNIDLDILQKENTIPPSHVAIDELENSNWVILTNGRLWRLYTRNTSAPATSYFQLDIKRENRIVLEYFVAIFSALTYEHKEGKQADIDVMFRESGDHATGLEEDLADQIIARDGIFISLVKGLLDYDSEKEFSLYELDGAKENALKIMYRILFLLYAESRHLLPVKDEKYKRISLKYLRASIDSKVENPNGFDCWEHLLKLFAGIRKGSPSQNLPQYNGELFSSLHVIDGAKIRNQFIIKALRDLFEKDGEYRDYAELSVRHIGNIYEQLLELSVRQADRRIAVLKNGTIVDIKSDKTDSKVAYFYKKGDLYTVLKGGVTSRKLSSSYYTPEKIVKFLVKRGLEPIFVEREKALQDDLKLYKKDPSVKNRQMCENRLMDIQVLDPAMGSGHFLVEALNQITSWVTRMLKKHPDHPILQDIELDRKTIIKEMNDKCISIDHSKLTQSALLKRKVLKRCIFGVDLNQLAVELTRLSLWLDSFVVGMPLTYTNHHIKRGDSIIGMWKKDLANPKNQSLDNWIDNVEGKGRIINKIIHNRDATIKQVRNSQKMHLEYEEQMNPYKSVLDVFTTSHMSGLTVPMRPPPDKQSRVNR